MKNKLKDINNEEGNLTVETSLVFPLYILTFVMLVSISIFIYKRVVKSLKINDDINIKMTNVEDVYEKYTYELNENNNMLFTNILDKIYSNFNDRKRDEKIIVIKKDSRISDINKTDYIYEKINV